MTAAPEGSDSAAHATLLEMRGITKRFPGVLANDHVDFDVAPGEVHALFGENGAGKSTLMRILYGLHRPDEGEIRLRDGPVAITSPAVAIQHGIGMIHQHFMLVQTLTAAENVALGLKSSRGPLTDLGRVSDRIRQLSQTYGLKVDPGAYIWQLSVGERQRVEIIKALYRDVSLLVLDEPTAVLTPQEVRDLFVVLKQLVADGLSIVFISHKVNEVLELSRRITVLRGGRKIATVHGADTTKDELADMMVGHQVTAVGAPSDGQRGPAALAVSGLRVNGDRGAEAVRGLSLRVASGEIVGLAGVSGNGQRELAEAIAGLRRPVSGRVEIAGTDVTVRNPQAVREAGLAYVPEERMRDALIGDFTVAENLILATSGDPAYARWGFLRNRRIRRHCRQLVAEFDIRTPGLDTPARNLSGGNIQKLIMARELSGSPKALVVAQPTRGIDVSAAAYIHQRLIGQRANGTAVLVISEDLDELMTISDRIVVIYEGTIIREVDPRTTSREAIGLMMAGVAAGQVRPDSAAAVDAAQQPAPDRSPG
ncbi:MAG TPA: ABC transporter ATP-binding protein [Streptosporangiaceae bacterium]|nr:ABC transporter ATP-binding protein [Streptosporangiaceae bacterium]